MKIFAKQKHSLTNITILNFCKKCYLTVFIVYNHVKTWDTTKKMLKSF